MKDPVSKTKISTPVRGRKCRHFSVSFEVVWLIVLAYILIVWFLSG
jgi:hypothetical protein